MLHSSWFESSLELRLHELVERHAGRRAPAVHELDLSPLSILLQLDPPPQTRPGAMVACPGGAEDPDEPSSTAPTQQVCAAQHAGAHGSGAQDAAGPATDHHPAETVARVRMLARQRSAVESALLEAAHALTADIGQTLLTHKGYADVDELTSSLRRRWRAETKRLAVAELQVALGLGVKEARQMVGVACAPTPVRTVVREALDTGLASWGHVRAFWDRCGSLAADEASLACESLFGSDPDTVVPERLAPDGTVLDRPWHQAEFWAALEREAVRVEGQDVVAERERRRRARAERRVWMRIDDDSTATLAITGPLTSLCAISQRLEGSAKALRKGGDERTLAQLRSDVAQTLLLHGRLELPDLGEDGLVTPDDSDTVAQVVTAQPAISLQVVVPWDALAGRPACATCVGASSGATGPAPSDVVHRGQPAETAPSVHPDAGAPHRADASTPQTPDTGEPLPPDSGTGSTPDGRPTTASDGPTSIDGPRRPDRPGGGTPPRPSLEGRGTAQASPGQEPPPAGHALPPPSATLRGGSVAELLGRHPAFISPGHSRELALTPGTTLSRLLVDPADGRLIERSVASYRPDAAMRRQVVAADVTSRAPGSRTPATACEIDHEEPWGAGGSTSETNLALKDVRSHQFKTEGWWTSALSPRRDLRWETVLGQIEQTRGHDYRQYLPSSRLLTDRQDGPPPVDATQHGDLGPTRHGDPDPTRDDDLDVACCALYAALAHRGVAALLADADDADGATDHDPTLSGWITMTHRGPDGQRRCGPSDDQATLASLLRMTPRTTEEGRQQRGECDDADATHGDSTSDDDTNPIVPGDATGGGGPRNESTDAGRPSRTHQPWCARRDDPPPF